ncbi:M3 family metallopeptidase [Sphingomonas hankyongi]|uniref:M3 family metallopeptidase n=1 Tax=Sphingomonas hankyongi TaxID=2908209 RepID=A0ABT0S555_9SPHN|nr:M3 family metallopeptidase [Sphingomonas hankyongi]MCL6730966.1 M3 family metallopeptidase [Sphingomonas hankyongi]
MIRKLLLASAAIAVFAAPAGAATKKAAAPAATLSASNPFAKPSALALEAPDFSKIKDSDYLPALLAGMAEQKREVTAVANQKATPTFDNTIVALERSGQLLERANLAFSAVNGANTNDTLQATDTKTAPLFAAHGDFIYLNAKLFQRVKYLHDHQAELNLNPEQAKVLDVYYKGFVHAGAELPAAKQAQLKIINKRLSTLQTDFTQKLLAAAKAGAVHVADASALSGLSQEQLAAAQEAAKDRKVAGYVLPLQNTTQQPASDSLTSHDARQKLFDASLNRAEHGDANDTRSIISEIAQLRAQKAALFGEQNWADYALYDQMAKKRETAVAFLDRLAPSVSAKERQEAADIRALAKAQGANFEVTPADWNFYAEQIRKQRYALNSDELKPYFEFNKVLTDGVFYAANQLYGLTFKERKDLPTWNPDMRVFDVFDADGKQLSIFYIDPWKRDNKSGGAWMSNLVNQSYLRGTKPVVFNVENFTKPAPGQPALISWDDVTTMFHEFGHALHGMFAAQTYPTLSGTNVARDFVEFPSQFNENWALDPKILPHYAVHYQSGQTIPQDLVDKIKKSRTFNQGYELGEALTAARLDLDWHSLPGDTGRLDVDKFEADALARGGFDVADVPPRYRSSYFLHIWSNGYSAGYYAYPWTRMLGQDAFNTFETNGGLTRANGQRFRDMVLSRGNTIDYADMYRSWAGHDPSIQPYLEYYGLSSEGATSAPPVPTPAPAAPAPKKGERGR